MPIITHVCSGSSELGLEADYSRRAVEIFPATTDLQINFGGDVAEGEPATGTVTLNTGSSGSVDSVTVNGVEVMSAPVAYNTSLNTTATDVAANIQANTSVPNYDASAVGAVITLTAKTNDKNHASANGFIVSSTATGITTTDTPMSGGLNDAYTLLKANVPRVYESKNFPDAQKAIYVKGTSSNEVYFTAG